MRAPCARAWRPEQPPRQRSSGLFIPMRVPAELNAQPRRRPGKWRERPPGAGRDSRRRAAGRPGPAGRSARRTPAVPVQKQPVVRRAGLAQQVGEQPLPVDQPGLWIMRGADILLLVAPALNPGFPPAPPAQACLLPHVRPAAALQQGRVALEGPQGCAAARPYRSTTPASALILAESGRRELIKKHMSMLAESL